MNAPASEMDMRDDIIKSQQAEIKELRESVFNLSQALTRCLAIVSESLGLEVPCSSL
jgi:hypothetical protein